MRLAMLCHMHHPIAEPYQGGTEAHTAMLADELVERGHDVTLFAKEGSQTRAHTYPLVPKQFEFTRVATPLVRKQQHGFLAEAVHHSIEVIQQGGYDAVINNSLSSLPYTFMRDLPMLTILHTPPTLADVTAIVTAPGWTPSPIHEYVTVSESNARAWRRLLPEVGVVLNGIDLDAWRRSVTPTPNLAVWAGRITPEKGLEVAIDAAVLADFDVEFAGPISHSDYFDTEIVPRMNARVRYRGHLAHDDLQRFLGSGSVFIASPLWAEPFGLSVVEALASGTPVAALPNGAMPELITPRAGALADDTSAASLAEAIQEASRCDRHGVRRSAERYSFDAMVDGYERILHDLAASIAESAQTRLG